MEEKRYYIDVVLEREKRRNENMRKAYEERISDLPKGSLVIRELNHRKYCYLKYRDGKKVVQKYAGTIEKEDSLCRQIAERKHLTELVVMLEKEYKKIERMEAVK